MVLISVCKHVMLDAGEVLEDALYHFPMYSARVLKELQ